MHQPSAKLPNPQGVDPAPGHPLKQLLHDDLFAQIAVGLFAASFLPFLVPGLDTEQRQAVLDSFYQLLLILALLVLRRGTIRLERLERSFWNDLSVVCGCWLTVSLLFTWAPTPPRPFPLLFYLSNEVLLAVGYGAWVLAAERQPHRRHRLRSEGLERALSWPTSTLFVTGLLTYFVLVPALLNRSEYTSFVPSMLLYFSLDAYLIGRFFLLARDSEERRWRWLYGGLMATAMGMLLADSIETLTVTVPGIGWGTPLDALYNLQLVVLILTARLRHQPLADASPVHETLDPLTSWRAGPLFPTLVTALAFPVIHFACYSLEWLDEASKAIRQLVVLWWIVLLGGLASVQHALLQRRARKLWRDWRRAEKALRRSEQKARVLLERNRVREAVREDREQFRQTFETIPTPLAIFHRADGRFRAVNTAFEHLVSLARSQLLGKTPGELGLWSRPRDAARLRRRLRGGGGTYRRDVVLRTARGVHLRVRLTAAPLRFEGTPSLIALVREPPPELRGLADLASGQPWLEAVDTGLWTRRDDGVFDPLNDLAREVETFDPQAESVLVLGSRGRGESLALDLAVTGPGPAEDDPWGDSGAILLEDSPFFGSPGVDP